MIAVVLAVIGAVVGLALDALVVRLAVPFDDEDGEGAPSAPPAEGDGDPEPSPPAPLPEGEGRTPRATRVFAGEAGTLVVERPYESKWLRRPAIVLATAGLFAAAALRYDDPLHLAIVTAYLCALIVAASTDALCYRVPNVVTYPAILGALVAGLLMPDADMLGVVAGGALAGVVLLLPSLLTGGTGMGMGDVKLVTFVGLALGLKFLAPAMLVMALLGGLVALVLLVTGARKRGEPIPYAPFISAGGIVAMLMSGTAFESL
jgi:prepilin signal peptidase PulO-like enzyme (type II secretory pathway)